MESVYNNPKYYEIAFSFRDIATEVDVFEHVIKQYSHIPVSTVLELGCGHAPHLAELVRRKYQYIGLDLSRAMLEYAQSKADAVNPSARFELADMTNFRLNQQVDFAFVLLGSLQARNTEELVSHFDCMGRTLKPGGLYFLDWCVAFAPSKKSIQSWEMLKGHVKVKTTSQTTLVNPVEQIYEETLALEVEDDNVTMVFRDAFEVRQIYPQEFLLFVAARSDFEFVGWWNNWDVTQPLTQPLDENKEISRPITILRRV